MSGLIQSIHNPPRIRSNHQVLRCYLQHGRKAIPINPKEQTIENQPCVASLAAMGGDPKDLAVSVITPPRKWIFD